MTTEKQSENTPSNNKVIFGPLGKYAVIAVIMVSIIVTSAIMLEKQLNTIDQQVAETKAGIAKSTNKNTEVIEIAVSTTEDVVVTEAVQTSTVVETSTAERLAKPETENISVAVTIQEDSESVVKTTPSANSISMKSNVASNANSQELTQSMPVAALNLNQTDTIQAKVEARQARLQSFKLEQKEHMSEIFARIKALETDQLDRYKTTQNNQVSNLRNQVTRQQQMIEALILRNKDLFELRAANVLRNQSNREQVLNRI